MTKSTSLKALLTMALALQVSSQAFACRVGLDQHLFREAPALEMLPSAQIIRVHFSNEPSAINMWPRSSPNLDGSSLDYTLIGVARVADDNAALEEAFPVYAFVTSCSAFWTMTFGKAGPIVDGEYYLIGRLVSDKTGRRFHAGGNHNGRWHY